MTPEQLDALAFMAETEGRAAELVLGDALLEAWVRFACRQGLSPPW